MVEESTYLENQAFASLGIWFNMISVDGIRKILFLILAILVVGCAQHKVDTFPEWCEQITGVDLEKKYRPFWAVIFSVSFDGDAIRDDYRIPQQIPS